MKRGWIRCGMGPGAGWQLAQGTAPAPWQVAQRHRSSALDCTWKLRLPHALPTLHSISSEFHSWPEKNPPLHCAGGWVQGGCKVVGGWVGAGLRRLPCPPLQRRTSSGLPAGSIHEAGSLGSGPAGEGGVGDGDTGAAVGAGATGWLAAGSAVGAGVGSSAGEAAATGLAAAASCTRGESRAMSASKAFQTGASCAPLHPVGCSTAPHTCVTTRAWAQASSRPRTATGSMWWRMAASLGA